MPHDHGNFAPVSRWLFPAGWWRVSPYKHFNDCSEYGIIVHDLSLTIRRSLAVEDTHPRDSHSTRLTICRITAVRKSIWSVIWSHLQIGARGKYLSTIVPCFLAILLCIQPRFTNSNLPPPLRGEHSRGPETSRSRPALLRFLQRSKNKKLPSVIYWLHQCCKLHSSIMSGPQRIRGLTKIQFGYVDKI